MEIKHLVKTITLGKTVIVDDLEQSEMTVTPGAYKVYKVRGGRWDNYAFLFVHKSVTNLDEQINRLDIDGTYSAEAGTYGMMTKPANDVDTYELWERHFMTVTILAMSHTPMKVTVATPCIPIQSAPCSYWMMKTSIWMS